MVIDFIDFHNYNKYYNMVFSRANLELSPKKGQCKLKKEENM